MYAFVNIEGEEVKNVDYLAGYGSTERAKVPAKQGPPQPVS